MNKVSEEQWKLWPDHWAGGTSSVQVNGRNAVWIETDDSKEQVCAMFHHGGNGHVPTDQDYARAHAIKAVPDLLAALESVEWVEMPDGFGGLETEHRCPWCDQEQFQGHAQDCPRQIALARARSEAP